MYDYFDALGRSGSRSGDAAMAQSGQAALMSDTLRRSCCRFSRRSGAGQAALPAGYPSSGDPFPARMAGHRGAARRGTAAALRERLEAESVFDTHDNQVTALNSGLDQAAQTLYAFQRDLESRGLADRVLTLVWSEFGRRPQENGSGGTDHGAAGCAFVIGTRAAGTHGRRVAGPRHRPRRRSATCGRPRTSGACTARCWSSGSGFDAARIIPSANRFQRVTLVK